MLELVSGVDGAEWRTAVTAVGTESGNLYLHGGAVAGGRRRSWRRRVYVVACEEERSVRPATVMD
jgi:hypothetical protein